MQSQPDPDHQDLDLLDMSEWNSLEMQQHYDMNSEANDTNFDNDEMSMSQPQDSFNCDLVPNVITVERDNSGGTLSTVRSLGYSSNTKRTVTPTIATIYEPKFYDIYTAYIRYVQQYETEIIMHQVDSQHLMSLCLNYLLSFSNWARDATNAEWIRHTLFENADMRPEVRNGLAMIIVYVFASAKAAELRNSHNNSSSSMSNSSNTVSGASTSNNPIIINIDMFTVLMKAESGLGIVNKTSLKIYSDPFGYFNFIKTCISGLIDASAIPENERINFSQPQSKKTRRGSKNKDEVEAYEYMKNSILAMFQNGSSDSLQFAKDRMNQILEYWHVKGKNIKNERFTSVFTLPPPIPNRSNVNNNNNNNRNNNNNMIMNSRTSSGSTGLQPSGSTGLQQQQQQQPAVATGTGPMVYPSTVSNRTSGRVSTTTSLSARTSSNRSSGEGGGGGLGGLTLDTSLMLQQYANSLALPGLATNSSGGGGGRLSGGGGGIAETESIDNDSVSTSSRSPPPSFLDPSTSRGGYGSNNNSGGCGGGSGGKFFGNTNTIQQQQLLQQQQQMHMMQQRGGSSGSSHSHNPSLGTANLQSLQQGSTHAMRTAYQQYQLQQQQQLQLQQQQQQLQHGQQGYGVDDDSISLVKDLQALHTTTKTSTAMTQLQQPPSSGGNGGGAASPAIHQVVHANTTTAVPVPSLRFDRMGVLSWRGTSSLLYDFEAISFVTQSTSFYLVDEMKLRAYLDEEILAKNRTEQPASAAAADQTGSTADNNNSSHQGMFHMHVSYQQALTGLGSLEKILQRSGSVVTSWSGVDFTQLKLFVDGWKMQVMHAQHKLMSNSYYSYSNNNSRPVSFGSSSMIPSAAIAAATASAVATGGIENSSMDEETVLGYSNNNNSNNNVGLQQQYQQQMMYATSNNNSNSNRSSMRRRTVGGQEMRQMIIEQQMNSGDSGPFYYGEGDHPPSPSYYVPRLYNPNTANNAAPRAKTFSMGSTGSTGSASNINNNNNSNNNNIYNNNMNIQNNYNNNNNANNANYSSSSENNSPIMRDIQERKTFPNMQMTTGMVQQQQLMLQQQLQLQQQSYGSGTNSPANESTLFFPPTANQQQQHQQRQQRVGSGSKQQQQQQQITEPEVIVCSMLDYWQILSNQQPASMNQQHHRRQQQQQQQLTSSTFHPYSRGLLIYERSLEVGLILRANRHYDIHEDLWCLYYPEDAIQQFLATLPPASSNQSQQQQPSSFGGAQQQQQQDLSQSFLAFLLQLLPQTRHLIKYLRPTEAAGAGSTNNNTTVANVWPSLPTTITLGYYAHHNRPDGSSSSSSSLPGCITGPPPPPGGSGMSGGACYRTLGGIDTNYHMLLSKFSTEAYFHDIVLH